MFKALKDKKMLFSELGLLYAAAIWGSTFFIVKDTISRIDPIVLVGYRFLLAAVVLGIILLILKKDLLKGAKQGIILGAVLWLLYVPQTIGLKYTEASSSGFITGLFILFTPILGAIFFKVRPSLTKIISVAIALVGLYILTGGIKGMNLGDILTIAAAFFYAVHILAADRFVKGFDPYVLNFQQFLTMGILSLATAIIFRFPLDMNGTFPTIVFLGIFPSLTAFVIQLVAQKHVTPVKVALILSMEPVFAAVFSWTLGGEHFIMSRAFGGLLIILAMILSEK